MINIVFDGSLTTSALYDTTEDAVELTTEGVAGEGFEVELGSDATLAVDSDDAFALLALRGGSQPIRLDQPGDTALLAALAARATGARAPGAKLPIAELAEAEWQTERTLVWSLEGATLTVVVEGAVRSQWAQLGDSGLFIALDLEQEGEAFVAALVHDAVEQRP